VPELNSYESLAKMIDHSLLQPALTVEELEAGCRLALRYDVASVCILPYYAARCAELLAGAAWDSNQSPGSGLPRLVRSPHGRSDTCGSLPGGRGMVTSRRPIA